MNFKTECLTFELDKSQSEILIENEVNELFDFVDLEADMTVEYYNQIVTPYLISLNLNPNEFNGYALYFYDIDNEVCLTKNQTSLDEKIVRIKLNSETLKKTNHFFNNKKYKKVFEL